MDRLGIPGDARVVLGTAMAAGYGMVHGVLKGARLASLRFLAENAHRLPRTKGNWYFFHKRKNYVVLKDGTNSGFKHATKYGLAALLFLGVEAALDTTTKTPDWRNTTAAAGVVGVAMPVFKRLPVRQVLRSAVGFICFGAVMGLVQDFVRKRRPEVKLVEPVKPEVKPEIKE